MRDEESKRLIQQLKPKKQTATMRRRALKPKDNQKVDREFLAGVQVEHE